MSPSLLSIFGGLIFFTCFTLAIIISIFGKLKLHKYWVLFNIANAFWGLSLFFVGNKTLDINGAIFWWKFGHFWAMFISIAFLHTVLELCAIKKRKILYFFYIVDPIFFIFLNFSNKMGYKLEFMFNSFYYVRAVNSIYVIATLLWFSSILYAFTILVKEYINSTGARQNQLKYLLFPIFIAFIGGCSHFLPTYGIKVFPFNIIMVFYPLIATYAILRYRIMDIRVAVAKGAIVGVVYTLVLGIPFGLAGWGRNWLMSIFGKGWTWVPMLALLLFATTGPYLFMYLQQKALNRLLADERHAHNLLLKASQGMVQIRNLRKLLGLIVHFITKALKTVNAQVFLSDQNLNQYTLKSTRFISSNRVSLDVNESLIQYLGNEQCPIVYEELKFLNLTYSQMNDLELVMKDLNASVIIPCLVEDALLGFLTLGDKKTGRMYTQDDLNVLTTLANQAALAIENAQFYEEVQRTQEQLFQAEKMATVGTMADGLSHQINNRFQALSMIAGDTIDTLKITKKRRIPAEIEEVFNQVEHALEKVQDNVKKGGEIVRGLLKYSRPGEQGFESVSLDSIVDAALEMAQYKVKLSEIEIKRSYSKNLPKIKGNLTQLQEVFFNLIDNGYFAIKQRKEELRQDDYKGIIDILGQQKDDKLQIKVSDNGMGVKKEDFDKLFTPFFTTKASAKKGTGLGLFVIQKIVTNNHKGKISVESTYKKGTTFIIELPVA
ncbi:MAG: GAF domain-containing protein [Candidatus Omnitrophica bacterium]|nr:GAF domain-containing protein [Candidatus Omnitrophota bacterium]